MEITGYKIQQTIGQGGMATAYLAVQESLGRPVVLKVLDTASQTSKESVERFLNEARIVAALNHPNIITIYDVGIAEDFIYISMEYIEGGDLRQRMRGLIQPNEALDIITRIAQGLDAAHKKGIIHRDVKPANILFRRDGTPLLTDFGIAKQLTVDNDLTSTGIFLGSPNYMAPEQAEGGSIDGRADIYSLGIIFYEMLTGEKPYKSDSVVDIIVQHKQAPIPLLPPGLEHFQPLLDLMLAKKRNDRFRDADSLLHFIQTMERPTVERAQVDVNRNVDFDITGTHSEITPLDAQVRHIRQAKKKLRPSHIVLGMLLAVAAGGYGTLSFLEHRYSMPRRAQSDDILPAGDIELAPIPTLADSGHTDPSNGATAMDDQSQAEVFAAMRWLAKKSLDDYRLINPPGDNAYYYYSRMLEIDPNSRTARSGLLLVAERFAFLAEKEIANNNFEKAQAYISIGLQVDPNNETLQALQGLAVPSQKGFFSSLLKLFKLG
jgi:tRNA A-37 threonylcarbamoyl transferase component Bud32